MALRVGLIGGGSVARVHLAGYGAIDEVAALRVAEANAAAHGELGRQPKVADIVADYRELLDDPSLDLIDICLPHHLHAPAAIAALGAGKAVICEKPIATTLDDADAMIAAAEAAGRPLYISHNMRFYPHHLKAKQLLGDGAIGRPFLAVLTVVGNELVRMNDPGAYIDTGFHATYTLHDFFGPPVAVTAVMGRHVVTAPNKADDTAAVIFEWPSLTATLSITYAATHHPWDERREIHGTEGSLYITDRQPPRRRPPSLRRLLPHRPGADGHGHRVPRRPPHRPRRLPLGPRSPPHRARLKKDSRCLLKEARRESARGDTNDGEDDGTTDERG